MVDEIVQDFYRRRGSRNSVESMIQIKSDIFTPQVAARAPKKPKDVWIGLGMKLNSEQTLLAGEGLHLSVVSRCEQSAVGRELQHRVHQ